MKSMQIFRKSLLSVLLAIFFLCIGWGVFIHLSYAYYMPHSPQPQFGRTYRMTVNHGYVVYVTEREYRRADFVFHDVFWIGMGCFVLVGMVKVYWGGWSGL
jgi:hypothetical protein